MSSGTLSAQQLRSIVETRWKGDDSAVAIGLHLAQPWKVPSTVQFESWKAEVVRADSVFQIREALLDAERANGRIILLTRLQQGDLGNDVVARLARSRLFPIDQWDTLCSLFKAKELDRAISEPSIAEALVEYAPAGGYPPVAAGVLDAATVWRATCRHVFDMGEREPDLVGLLLWAVNTTASSRYRTAAESLRNSMRQRLVANLGDAADSILRIVDANAGADAVALAVVCQVVFGEGDQDILETAAARMEQHHGNKPIPVTAGRALGRIANDAAADLERMEDSRLEQHLRRADDLLKQLRCEDFAWRSRLTLRGYEARLSRLGLQITQALTTFEPAALEACERAQAEVEAHRRARGKRRSEQVARTEMALRLLRWLATPSRDWSSFAEMADAYRSELAFVDWARESVCRGEDVADLTEAYRGLDRAALARREQFNRKFAEAMRDWTSTGSTFNEVYGVEEVLFQFVRRIVDEGNRVLLIVLDGMSWAVCHELLEDIRNEHWLEATFDASFTLPHPVIATVPSVTNYSRASLLSGRLTKGDAAAEKQNFEANDALNRISDRRSPPILFHKKEVTDGSRGAISADLEGAILSRDRKVVGLVLNAIDDRLSTAQQIQDDWTLNRISPLGNVLKLARDAERVVILASDHGHVWHRPEAQCCPGDAGTRWRSPSGKVNEGEMAIAGQRVRAEGNNNTVVVPFVETIYYGKQQNGYHGGATPQEMVSPLVILMDQSKTKGLYECPFPKPEWWSSRVGPARPREEDQSPAVLPSQWPKTLFDMTVEEKAAPTPPSARPSTGWIANLLSSAGYKDQKALVRRHVVEDDVVRRCLEALETAGGMLTRTAFSHATEIPAARLDGLISQIQRLLNVDGYEILSFSRVEDRIELNTAKLKRQFDLE